MNVGSHRQTYVYGFEGYGYCDQARLGKVTKFAKEYKFGDVDGIVDWWLRSPGINAGCVVGVSSAGNVSISGGSVDIRYGVRPALWINLSYITGYVKDVGKENIAIKSVEWDTVNFGFYNEKKLTWRVLYVSEDDAFLLSDKIIDRQEYNNVAILPNSDEDTDVTWENCTLRAFLNDDFYNDAFNSNEKAMIKDTNVINDDNDYGISGGNSTIDKVYLLSLSEITNTLYGFPDAYGCQSDTRIAKNTWGSGTSAGWWWLRSPGSKSNTAAGVSDQGYITASGSKSGVYGSSHIGWNNDRGVRPALHINLSSSAWTKGKVTTGDDQYPLQTQSPTQVPSQSTRTGNNTDITQKTPYSTTVTVQNTPDPSTTTTAQPAATEKTLKISSCICKKNTKKIAGKLSVSGAVVKIKIGKKAVKKATVKGKKFTLKLSYRLKKKTKVTITVTKKDYKTLKKVYVVK